MKRLNISIVMPALLLALVFSFLSCDNGTTSISGTTVPGSNLAEKLAWLQDNAESGGSYIVELLSDESTDPVDLNYSDRTGITIGLRGSGANRTISFSNRWGIQIRSGVTLVLDRNITLNGGMVYVEGGGELVMNAGSTITGTSGSRGGGAVIVGRSTSTKGTFTMNGGTISGNNGVGVYSEGLFTMNGGTISDNTIYVVTIARGGIFTMNGGTISGNTSRGVTVVENATFTMNGGTISGNIGGGVSIESSTFTMRGGTISGNTTPSFGGGVSCAASSFTMSGGSISGNTAGTYGGGVSMYFNPYSFTKTGGTITGSGSKDGNTAQQNNGGNAICFLQMGGGEYIPYLKKETTSGPADNLSFKSRIVDGSVTTESTGEWEGTIYR